MLYNTYFYYKTITRICFYVSLSTFPSSRKKIRNPYLLIITITIPTISIITNIKYKYIVRSKITITTMLHNAYCYYKTITRIFIYASLSSPRSYRLSQLCNVNVGLRCRYTGEQEKISNPYFCIITITKYTISILTLSYRTFN